MRKFVLAAAAAFALTATAAVAGDAPKFYQETYPEHALGPAMEWDKALKGEDAPLDAKTQQLISVAVAAQIPCRYCVYAHLKMARAAGASEAEIKHAVAMAARIRHWSTVMYGMKYDLDAFEAEVDQLMAGN